MKEKSILLELFSGIGGFAKGLEMAGFEFTEHYYSEIYKHAIANYKNNFKNAENVGDVRNIQKGTIGKRPDIVTFGFPCQDLSIAGKRKGLSGSRSALFHEAVRIVEELRPPVFIFENVKNLLSSHKGKDFEIVLRTIADLGIYECEWQLLNTSWVLPQNRERLFFIGHLTGESKPKVFPFRENDFGIIKGKPDTAVVRTITAGGNSGGHHSGMTLIRQVNKNKNFGSSTKNKDRVYSTKGIMCCITNNRPEDKLNILLEDNENSMFIRPRGFNKGGVSIDSPTITKKSHDNNYVINNKSLRRLTEIECERLQGFPDDWTKFGDYNGEIKPISKTNRYKMIGDAVSTPLVKLIGERLKK